MPDIVYQTDSVLILDNVLEVNDWNLVWKSFQVDRFSPQNIIGIWTKTWRYAGMIPASSEKTFWKDKENKPGYNNYSDILGTVFLQIAEQFKSLTVEDWGRLRVHGHVMPAGSKICYHCDSHSRGSFTYYPHQEWSSNWGGEMLVSQAKSRNRFSDTFDFIEENDWLKQLSMGIFIEPKPNRLVLLAPGFAHMVCRVDPDAGDHVRASIVGFLMQQEDAK